MHSESLIEGAEQVSQDTLEAICKLALLGPSPEAISCALDLNVQTVIQVIDRGDLGTLHKDLDQEWSQCKQAQSAQEAMLQAQSKKTQAKALNRDLAETSLQDTREALNHEVPTFIYSYKYNTAQLHRTSLVTGEQSSLRVPSYTFKDGCCWSEVPGGSLLITGRGFPAVREVVRIDTRREFAACFCPPMLTSRYCHASVYHTPHLYILGGWIGTYLRECERYVCAVNRWEALPPLPKACSQTSGVVVENSLYALGGYDGSFLDLVQKLSLESLTWELMQFRLPFAGYGIPCFKLRDTEVYLVVNQTLCSFTAFEVRSLKTLTENIQSWYGASYYHKGTLYCSSVMGGVLSLEIESLS
jgi:hypothetical protein